MKLNAKTCKSQGCVSLKLLKTVSSHKVLGLVTQEYLKWNERICMTVFKAKHLHIILVIRRGGVSAVDLVVFCVALLRSVLEKTVANALPAQPNEMARVQMRALRIIYQRSSCEEALQFALNTNQDTGKKTTKCCNYMTVASRAILQGSIYIAGP